MDHEKVFKLDDESRIKVKASLVCCSGEGQWKIDVSTCPKGGKKFQPVVNVDSFAYRNLNNNGRVEFAKIKNIEIAGAERIHEVQLELWEKIKPSGYFSRTFIR